jgi:hypothetical protein
MCIAGNLTIGPGADMIPDLSREIWNTVSNQHMTLEAKRMGFFTFTSTNQVPCDVYLMINMCSCIWLFFPSVSGVLPVWD